MSPRQILFGKKFKLLLCKIGELVMAYDVEWVRNQLNIDLFTTAAQGHVPRAENAIRFVKERVRAIQCNTPFNRYPKRFTIEMVNRVVSLIVDQRIVDS